MNSPDQIRVSVWMFKEGVRLTLHDSLFKNIFIYLTMPVTSSSVSNNQETVSSSLYGLSLFLVSSSKRHEVHLVNHGPI